MSWDIRHIGCGGVLGLEKEVQRLCAKGWELVSVVHDGSGFHAFLKRPRKVTEE